jgi:hypothetical protein
MVQPDRPDMTIKYGTENMRFACRITKARIQTHTYNIVTMTNTLIMFNIYCFFTTKMVIAKAPQCYVIYILPILFRNGKLD